MKKKGSKKGLKIFACIVAVIVITHCTPGMALRTSAFMYDMGSAFTLEYKMIKYVSEHKTIYRITENVPIEKSTQGELTTWLVHHFGPFNFATYYGEG